MNMKAYKGTLAADITAALAASNEAQEPAVLWLPAGVSVADATDEYAFACEQGRGVGDYWDYSASELWVEGPDFEARILFR